MSTKSSMSPASLSRLQEYKDAVSKFDEDCTIGISTVSKHNDADHFEVLRKRTYTVVQKFGRLHRFHKDETFVDFVATMNKAHKMANQ